MGETIAGVLAAGDEVEVRLRSSTGAIAASMRLSEIDWEGEPHFLATLRDGVALADGDLHYREIVQSSPDLIFVNRGGRVSYVNEAGVKLLRATDARDIVGRSPLEFFHPSNHASIRERIALLLKGPRVAQLVEEKLVALDGTAIDVDVRAVSFLSHGDLVIQVICRDVSERKAAQRALRTGAERFHQLAEAMPQIVWTANPDGVLDYASKAFSDYTGTPLTETPVERWVNAVHPDDKKSVLAAWDQATRTGEAYAMEFRIRRGHDGAYRWHYASAVPIRDDGRRIVKWFGSAIDIHDRRASQETARRLAAQLQVTLEGLTDAFFTIDHEWRFTYLNKEAERITRKSRAELLGKRVFDVFAPAIGSVFEREARRAVNENRMVEFQAPASTVPGLWVEVRAYPFTDGLAVYVRDISERRDLEARLHQAQRLEAVGQLTGGIAHDFNNLLTVIMGNAEVLVDRLAGDPALRQLADMTATAAERGAELTQRLLAFARKQALEPRVVDVNELVAGMSAMLRRTLGEQVDIEFVRGANLWKAFIDAPQLESAVLNLSINARDAMPEGGRLTIETANVTLDNSYARHNEEVAPGDYVMVAVSDSGTGMAPGVVARAFEPFFTTKEVGKGTGLGLSMVHGFVKQSLGHVKLYSEFGHGTTVKLYLPKATADACPATQPTSEAIVGGSERILLVEDDAQVRDHVALQLTGLGYRVVAVAGGADALHAMRTQTFDLLFTDVIMPGGMNGPQLSAEARKRSPDLRVLYTSGYTENAIVHGGRLDPGIHLLNKPYRRSELAAKVREALGTAVG